MYVLPVDLLEQSLRPKFASVVADGHADELVHGPNKERDDEPSEPCPTAGAENVQVTEIEDTKRQDVKK